MKHDYITRVFDDLEELKRNGIFFSGIFREGEFKSWHKNGRLAMHCSFKDDAYENEYKDWYENGQLAVHCFYKNNKLSGDFKRYDGFGKLIDHVNYIRGRKTKDYLK